MKFAYPLLFLWILSGPVFGQKKIKSKTYIYQDTLAMDVYTPQHAVGQKLPVLVYVHGGGFSGGKRDEPLIVQAMEDLASAGWLTVSISYHLTMKGKSFSCDQAVQNKINTMFVAAQNVHSAVKYLIETQSDIDPDKIVLAGSSAGAEAVMQAAYWAKTSEGILPDSFKYAGVVSMAGAVMDINWITSARAIPTAMFHGTCDPLVPYGTASHHFCEADATGFMMLFGAETIAGKLLSLNSDYFLFTDCGGGHEWAGKPLEKEWLPLIKDFLSEDILAGKKRQRSEVVSLGNLKCESDTHKCR